MIERHFISYPKSGRTWLRYALTELGLAQEIRFHHDGFEFNDGTCPTHDFDMDRRLQCYQRPGCRVVYLSRDPRDVMVSLYHQVTGRFQDFFGYQGDLSSFIRDGYFGAENLRRFRALWESLCGRDVAMAITYEECHRDMAGVLRRIVDHLLLESDDVAIARAVESSSFSAMQEIELNGRYPEPWMRPRNDAFKVRKGKVGGYLEELDPSDITYLNRVFGLIP